MLGLLFSIFTRRISRGKTTTPPPPYPLKFFVNKRKISTHSSLILFKYEHLNNERIDLDNNLRYLDHVSMKCYEEHILLGLFMWI